MMHVSTSIKNVLWYIQTKQLTEVEAMLLESELVRYYESVIGFHNRDCAIQQSRKSQNYDIRNQGITTFLENFWTYDTSEYIQNKISHGQNICKRYCWSQRLIIKNWREFFCNPTLYPQEPSIGNLSPSDMAEFELYLKKRVRNGKRLRNETINNIIKCGKFALKWAVSKRILLYNPVDSLTAYSVHTRERGILSRKETAKLFSKGSWKDERVKTACLISMTTGMREGEILALRKCDISERFIHVRHTWHSRFGLKCPKNGEVRKVPLYPEVKSALEKLIKSNPHATINDSDEAFIFWSKDPFRPLSANVLTKRFNQALRSSEHSAQVVLGHLSPLMTRPYANHSVRPWPR